MTTDVFLRVAPQGGIRLGMAMACLERWKAEKTPINLQVIAATPCYGSALLASIVPFTMVLPLENFQWTSRAWADENATSDPYVFVDDDRIPMHDDWLPNALSHWNWSNKHKTYPMLVDVSALKCERYCDIIPEIRDSQDLCVASPCWAGPNYLSYKGAIPYREFSGPAHSQDMVIEDWAKKRNLKQAVMVNVTSNHLAVGYSQAQPLLFGRF